MKSSKSKAMSCHAITVCLAFCLAFPRLAFSLPSDASVNQGSATITESGDSMIIDQQSDRVSIDYQGFDIGVHEQVIFQQPSINSVALNRVIGNDASSILGLMKSNGQVFLINPNGIVFGESAHIDVGGLIASTLNIDDQDFMAGNYQFSGEQSAAIINDGLIQAAKNGMLVFIGDELVNHGEMGAEQGHIELIAADDVTIERIGDSVSIVSSRASISALIQNHGLIEANGGAVVFNADAMSALDQTVVNNTGVVRANRIEEHNGEIYITGSHGDLIIDGELVSSATGNGNAGVIELSGDRIAVLGQINASGDLAGNGGNVSISANDVIVLADGAEVSADAGERGDGGNIIAFSPGTSLFQSGANLSATGGSEAGDGGFIEVSGLEKVEIFGQVNTSAAAGETGTFYIDPYDITISSAVSANGAFDALDPNSWEGSGVGTSSTINNAAITAALASSDVTINTALDNGSGPGTGTGNITIDDDIDLDGGNGNTLSLTADGSISLAANVNIADASTVSADAVGVNLTAGGNITLGSDADIQTTGGISVVVAGGIFSAASDASIDTQAGTLTVLAGGVQLAGSLLSANAGPTAIVVNSGSTIVDDAAAGTDIIAVNGGLSISAQTGIDLDIDARQLDITNAVSGAVSIDAQNAIELTEIDVASDFSLNSANSAVTISNFTSSENFTINTGGTLTINDGVLVDVGSSLIDIDTVGDMTVTGLVTLDTSAASISLDSAAGSILDGGDTNTDVDARDGRANLTAATGINNIETFVNRAALTNTISGDISIDEVNNIVISSLSSVGDATILAGTTIQFLFDTNTEGANGATYTFDAGADLVFSQNICEGGATCTPIDDHVDIVLNAGGDITFAAGAEVDPGLASLSLDAAGTVTLADIGINTAGDVQITANDILDVSGRDLSIVADDVFLDIANVAANTSFTTTVNTADLNFGGSGNVDMLNDTSLTLVDSAFDANSNALNFATQNVSIASNFTLLVSDEIDLDGANGSGLSLAGLDITLAANSSIQDFNTGTNDAVNLSFVAANDISFGNDADIFTTGGNSTVVATGNFITAGNSSIQTGLGVISVTANDVDLVGKLTSESSSDAAITVISSDQIADSGNATIDMEASNGGVVLVANNGIELDTQVATLSLTNSVAGDVIIDEEDSLTISNLDIQGGDTTISALNGGNLSLSSDIDLDGLNGSTLTLSATGDLDTVAGNQLTDNDTGTLDAVDINLVAGGEVFVRINNTINSYGGDITISAGGDFDTRNATFYNAGSGQIAVTAADVSLVSSMISASALSDAISITSGNMIVDGGAAYVDVQASSGGAILQAANGIDVDTRVASLSVSNTTSGSVTIEEFDALELTTLAAAGDVSVTAGGVLTVPDTGLNIGTNDLSLTATDIVDVSGRILDLTAGALALNTQTVGGSSTFNTTVTSLDLTNGGTNDVSIIETDALTLTGLSANGTTGMTTGGVLTIPDAGLNVGTNDLSLTATDIVDISGRAVDLTAGALAVATQTAGGDAIFNTTVTSLDLSNSASNQISVNETDNLTIAAWSNAGDSEITTGGILTLPNAGLNAGANNVSITATDVIDSDRVVSLLAGSLTLNTQTNGGNSTFNTSATSLDLTNGGVNEINIFETDALTLLGLSSNGSTNISAGGPLVIPDSGLDVGTNDLSLTATDIVDLSGRSLEISAGALTLDTQSLGGDSIFNTTVGSLDLNNAGANQVTINETDSITLAGWSNAGVSVITAGGVLTLPDAGLDVGVNNLSLTATDIVDSDRSVNLAAGALLINSQTAGGASVFNTTASTLALTNTAANQVTINEADDLTIGTWSNTGDSSITVGGTLTIPDAGLTGTGRAISISSNDINDVSGRELSFTANELSLDLVSPAGDISLVTDVDVLQVIAGGPASVSVLESDDLSLRDLLALGSAVDINSGNFAASAGSLTISDDVLIQQGNITLAASGDVAINADLTANDALGDGVREGLIDIAIDDGSLMVGSLNAASIISNNTVDQAVNDGLGSVPSQQVSIRIRQTDTSASVNVFEFGDNAGNDVLVRAVGGDILVDSVNGVTLVDPVTREVVLNSDVTLESFNSNGDALDGVVGLTNTTDNGAILIARSDRVIQVNDAPVVIPPVDEPSNGLIPPVLDDVISDLFDGDDSIENDQDPLGASDPSIAKKIDSDSLQVSNTFQRAFGTCSTEDKNKGVGSCGINDILVKFLGAFVIGGALPSGG